MIVEERTHIDADTDSVYSIISKATEWPRWHNGIVSMKLSNASFTPGAKGTLVTRDGRRVAIRCQEAGAPTHLAIEEKFALHTVRQSVTLQGENGSTWVNLQLSYHGPAGKLHGILTRRHTQDELAVSLRALKKIAEAS
ncbi:MAG: SRPBCC family protein [Pseudomonadota bacterium]